MEPLTMSVKERARLEVFGRVSAGDLTLVKASELLGLSYRQTKRSWSRYQGEGAAGLVHGLRGRSSNRQPDGELKRRALELYASRYWDYGPTLAAECLREENGLDVSVETLRRWLISAGLWSRRRQRKAHRRRRARKEQLGELIQLDGSMHDWFEGRRGQAVLMVMIDDAARPWVHFALAAGGAPDDLSPQVDTVIDVFSCFRGYRAVTYFDGTAWVTHSVSELRDLEE